MFFQEVAMSRMLNVRLSDEEWSNLERKAQEWNLPRSEYVRTILAENEESSNTQKIISNKVIRNLSEVQMMVDALKRKHRNMNFTAIEEKLEETLYELCEKD